MTTVGVKGLIGTIEFN